MRHGRLGLLDSYKLGTPVLLRKMTRSNTTNNNNTTTTTTSSSSTTTANSNNNTTSQELIVKTDYNSFWNLSWWGEPTTTADDKEEDKKNESITAATAAAETPKEATVEAATTQEDPTSSILHYSASPSPQPNDASSSSSVVALDTRVDYASKSLGALILDASPDFSGASHVLQQDNDKYAIIPCATPSTKFLTIGLSEDILVKRIVLANYERYSSHMHDIRVAASSVPGQWNWMGDFLRASSSSHNNNNGGGAVTTFDVPATWARYLRLEFLSPTTAAAAAAAVQQQQQDDTTTTSTTEEQQHYYCTITQLSVYGSTMLQGFHEQWEEEHVGVEPVAPTTTTTTTVETRTTTTTSTAVAVEPVTTTLEFVPQWKGTATCPVIPFYDDGYQDDDDDATDTTTTTTPPDATNIDVEAAVAAMDNDWELLEQLEAAAAAAAAADEPPEQQHPVDNTEEMIETTNTALQLLLHKFPSAKCLGRVQLGAGGGGGGGGVPSPPSAANTAAAAASPNIFTKLSAEIKQIQSTLTHRDQQARDMALCYQTVLLEVLVAMDTMQIDQDTRIETLEAELHAVSSLADAWWHVLAQFQAVRRRVMTPSSWTSTTTTMLLLLFVLAVVLVSRRRYYYRSRRRQRQPLTHPAATTTTTTAQQPPSVVQQSTKKRKRRKPPRHKAWVDVVVPPRTATVVE